MASLTGKKIQNTYTGLLQVESGSIQDGLGNTVNLPTNQFSGSVLISSSVQLASDISGAFHHSASNLNSRMGQTEINTTNNQNAISRLTALTSSYAFTANISGSFDSISSSLASRVDSNDTELTTKADKTSISGSFNIVSSSLAERDTINETNISQLTGLTSSYARVDNAPSFQTNVIITGSLIVTGSIISRFGNAWIRQTNERISLQAPGSGSGITFANVSVQQLTDGSTRTLVYGDDVQLGAYNSEDITIGNNSSSLDIVSKTTSFSGSVKFLNTATGSFSGSFEGVALSKDTGSYATTASNSYSGSTVFTGSVTVRGHELFNLLPSDPLPVGADTGSFAVTGSTLAFYDGNNWVTVVTGSTLPL